MTKRISVLLSLLFVALIAYSLPFPTFSEITGAERKAIVKNIEWSGHGNTMTGKLPIIEIPEKDPIFRIVRVFTFEKSGEKFSAKSSFFTIDGGIRLELGEFIREYDRKKRQEKLLAM